MSSTTVNLILTLRKAASLSISVWYYGSGVTPGLVVGGALVLGGTMVYSFAPPPVDPRAKKHEEEVKAGNGAETDGVEKNTATASASAVKANDRLRHRHT